MTEEGKSIMLQTKIIFTVFSDIKGIMPHKYLPVGQTVDHYSYKDVLEGLRGKRTVAKERSYGSTNGICHSALSIKQFFTQKKSPALFAKSRLMWIFIFTEQYFHKRSQFQRRGTHKGGYDRELEEHFRRGFRRFRSMEKGNGEMRHSQ